MSLIKDALEYLDGLSAKTRKFEAHTVAALPGVRYLTQGDERQTVEVDRETVHRYGTLDSLVAFAVAEATRRAETPLDEDSGMTFAGGASFYVSPIGVWFVAGHDGQSAADATVACLPLDKTPGFAALETYLGKWLSHGDLVDLLRTELKDAAPVGLLSEIRTLRWGTSITERQDRGAATDGLGVDVDRRVSGANELKDFWFCQTRVYAGADFEHLQIDFELSIVLNHNEKKLSLRAAGDKYDREKRDALVEVRRMVKETLSTDAIGHAIPVFVGDPPRLLFGEGAALGEAEKATAKR